jgi:quinol monooxygenase YgiN
MLKLVAKFIVKEDKIEEFKKYAEELVTETRKENGCISYQLFQDINDSKILTFIEEWENQKSIDNHNNSKHITGLLPKLMETLKEDPVLNVNQMVF